MSALVLVIEDNPANLQLMEYLLRAYGYRLTSAVSGSAGVEGAIRDEPDLVLCDIQLPDMDGFEVIDRLKAHPATRSTPVVAVTAYAMAGDRKRMLESGFDGYISKPIDPAAFVPEVEAFMPDWARAGKRPEAAAAGRPRRRQARDGVRVLAVDDSQANLGVLRAILEPRGFDVIPARSPRQALKLAHENPPDLVISDVHMEDGGGFELIRRIKADDALRDIPFIFASTTVWREAEVDRAMRLGANEFIFRPVEPDSLVATIKRVLTRHQHGKDRRR